MWKAATYMRPRDTYTSIPAIKVDIEEITDNQRKIEIFLNSFFPKMAKPKVEEEINSIKELS
jgi:hypothetical protein